MAASGVILVVGEKLASNQILLDAVSSFGFSVVCVDSTSEGIDSVRANRPSLMIYDQDLVDAGDQDFAAAIDRCGLKECPLVAIPSVVDEGSLAHALMSGADDIVALDADAQLFRDRIAFWMVGGFVELPMELRRRAGEYLSDHSTASFTDANGERLNKVIVEEVTEALRNELAALDPVYGRRKVEKICFLGRLSKLVLERSSTAIDYMRFPDYCVHIVRSLGNPHLSDMAVLFKRFEAWSCDPRFVFSGVEALRPTSEYEWYSSDYADEF